MIRHQPPRPRAVLYAHLKIALGEKRAQLLAAEELIKKKVPDNARPAQAKELAGQLPPAGEGTGVAHGPHW